MPASKHSASVLYVTPPTAISLLLPGQSQSRYAQETCGVPQSTVYKVQSPDLLSFYSIALNVLPRRASLRPPLQPCLGAVLPGPTHASVLLFPFVLTCCSPHSTSCTISRYQSPAPREPSNLHLGFPYMALCSLTEGGTNCTLLST